VTTPIRHRVRIRFSKQGDLRWISHRDLLRTLERLFRRSALPLGMTEGYHPRPRMSFPLALAVGIASEDEVMELELAEIMGADELLARLREQTVPGLQFTSVVVLAPNESKAQADCVTFEVPLPAAYQAEVALRIERLLAEPTHLVERSGRARRIDVRRDIRSLRLAAGTLRMQLATPRDASARPREVLKALGLDQLEREGLRISRTRVELSNNKKKDES